jgi:predicted transcriptional regulator
MRAAFGVRNAVVQAAIAGQNPFCKAARDRLEQATQDKGERRAWF